MPNLAVADGGQGGSGPLVSRATEVSMAARWSWQVAKRAATLACQGYHWQDQERCVKNINFPSPFPGLLDEGPQTKKMGFRRKQSWKSHCLL